MDIVRMSEAIPTEAQNHSCADENPVESDQIRQFEAVDDCQLHSKSTDECGK